MRFALLTAVPALALLLAGCNEDAASPEPPRCLVEPASMTFPTTLRPHRTFEQVIHSRNLTLTNDPLRVSSGGSRPLEGTVHFEVEGFEDPSFLIRFEEGDGDYLLNANESHTFKIEVVVKSTTAPGTYRGAIEIGTDCDPVPFTIEVQGRPEAPPAFVETWGGPGGGEGEFTEPIRIHADAAGFVYVVETGNRRVQILDGQGRFAGAFEAGITLPTAVLVDDFADSVVVRPPVDLVRTTKVYYVAQRSPIEIEMYDRERESIKSFGVLRTGQRLFQVPVAMAFNFRRELVVLDAATSRVITFDATRVMTAEELSSWGSQGPAEGQVLKPADMEIAGSGNVFISDTDRDRVSVFGPTGTYLYQIGGTGDGAGRLDGPVGIAFDASENLYVADATNRRVMKFAPDGSFLTSWNGETDGPLQLSVPVDVAVAPDGRILVLDLGRSQVVVFSGS